MINLYDLIFYIILWTLFGIFHSLLATHFVKDKISLKSQFYRIFYNIVATITFLIVLVIIPSPVALLLKIRKLNLLRVIVVITLFTTGAIITGWGIRAWDLKGFLGLAKENDDLNTNGPYQFSRHPVYSGIILILIGLLFIEISTNSLSWLFGAGGYFVIGSYFEEKKLEDQFGEEYISYRQSTARIFPYLPHHFRRLFS